MPPVSLTPILAGSYRGLLRGLGVSPDGLGLPWAHSGSSPVGPFAGGLGDCVLPGSVGASWMISPRPTSRSSRPEIISLIFIKGIYAKRRERWLAFRRV
jgi:hypothetical protein